MGNLDYSIGNIAKYGVNVVHFESVICLHVLMIETWLTFKIRKTIQHFSYLKELRWVRTYRVRQQHQITSLPWMNRFHAWTIVVIHELREF